MLLCVICSISKTEFSLCSAGYLGMSFLQGRIFMGKSLAWEECANNRTPTAETASANVTSRSATQGGVTGAALQTKAILFQPAKVVKKASLSPCERSCFFTDIDVENMMT